MTTRLNIATAIKAALEPKVISREAQLIDVVATLRRLLVSSTRYQNDALETLRAIGEADKTLADPDYRTPRKRADRQQLSDDQADVEMEANQSGVDVSEIIKPSRVEP